MNFLCPSCRTPLPIASASQSVSCPSCGVVVDLTGIDTAPGQARLWPQIDLATDTLGSFKLQSTLGAGGMGAVYAGTGPDGAPVAVKVLAPLLAAEPGLRERFKRETHALRALTHPGIVRILDEGEERGFCWYAMEKIDGSDLRVALRTGPLTINEVESLARALLQALSAVHEAGLVHRDIKPGNILMSAQGPKLCDFGIARFDGQATLTESAAILGSLRYMAPEQRWGKSSPLSDLYGVGVVLHETLWGGVPGEVTTDSRAVPKWLSDFVEKLSSTRPEDRPSSALEALRWLDVRKGRVRRQLMAAAAVVGIAVISILALRAPVVVPEEPVIVATIEPVDAGPVEVAPPVVVVETVAAPPFEAGVRSATPPFLGVKPMPPKPKPFPPKGKKERPGTSQ